MSIVHYLKRGNTEVARAALAEIKEILKDCRPGLIAGTWRHVGGRGDMDPKEWAKVLKVKHQCGEQLLPIQIEMYRSALKGESED